MRFGMINFLRLEDKESYKMKDGQNPVVQPDDYGIRPAGEPDRCFYCHRQVGEFHKDGCVMITKPVKIKATLYCEIDVPQHWDKERIEYHFNDGTWCADNLLNRLNRELEERGTDFCLCPYSKIEVIDNYKDDEDEI